MPKTDKNSRIGLILAGFTVVMKSTKLIAAFKVLKFSKPLITVISMLISAIFYGIWLGPWFAVGLVAMLFIHEMGHIIALRIKGYETHGPVFIPFLGALIFAPKFDSRDTEAFVGYGGPLLGTIAAFGCFALWYVTGQRSEILLLVSYVGVFLNLFNLIPVSPLDGGRITQAVGSWFKYVGLALLLAYTLAVRQPPLLLIWILVLDGFDRFTLWLRPSIATILGVAMAALMYFGYSQQPWYIDIVDCLIATALTMKFWYNDADKKKGDDSNDRDDRLYPAGGVRARWLACYLGLAAVAALVIIGQEQYLPHAVRSNSEQQMTSPPAQVQ